MDFFEIREQRGEHADEETEKLATLFIGVAIEVHKALGPGHPEKVYEEALCHEMDMQKIPYMRQAPIKVSYKGKVVGESWIDLLIGDRLIVELKSVERIADVHLSQALAYLAATDLRLALVINFNVVMLKQGIKRVVRDPKQQSPS